MRSGTELLGLVKRSARDSGYNIDFFDDPTTEVSMWSIPEQLWKNKVKVQIWKNSL